MEEKNTHQFDVSIINELLLSKKSVKLAVEHAEYLVEQNASDSADMLILAKYMETLAKAIKGSKLIKEAAIETIESGLNSWRGVKMETAEYGVTWDYSKSPAHAKALREVIEAKEVLKQVENLAQNCDIPQVFTFPDGEMLPVRKAVRKSTTSPKITLP